MSKINKSIFEKLNKLNELNNLNEEIKTNIKLLYIFRDNENEINVILITNEDEVYCCGHNKNGVLGFGHQNNANEFTINKALSNKRVIDFKNSYHHTIARDINGKLYCWGRNRYLGNGREDEEISKPELNKYFINENIIDMCCGVRHTLVLTSNNEVYGWGRNDWGQIGNTSDGLGNHVLIPFKLNEFNGEKVKAISCGYGHSMALTEGGSVYSWGNNRNGQLGLNSRNEFENKPKLIQIGVEIKKISCGREHSLLLSCDGDIYVFGWNGLGSQKAKKRSIPIKLENENKFIEIASHYKYNISTGLSDKEIIFIWGKISKEEVRRKPFETQFKSFYEVFANYFQITSKTLDFGSKTGNGRYSEEFIELNFIASGSFGIVCKAIEKKNNKVFAIKKIPIEKKSKPKALKEIEIMLKLKSDFIVRLKSSWLENNYLKADDFKEAENSSLNYIDENKILLLHIQMEFCSKTLNHLFKQLSDELNQKLLEVMTPLGYYISSELFIEILESVDYLHKQNIIHRDLKPNNILITDGKNGRFVKIADFGLATIHEFEGQSHTKYSGTPKYRAPEVCSRNNKYDLKADIYSLGWIIQELFNFDINDERIGENTELEDKYNNIYDLTEKMTATQKNKRPDCDQMLAEKNSWALSLNELQMNQEFESKRMKFSDEIFHLYFIETKMNKTQ